MIRVVDFETTGLPPEADVVEAAYIDVIGGGIITVFIITIVRFGLLATMAASRHTSCCFVRRSRCGCRCRTAQCSSSPTRPWLRQRRGSRKDEG